MSKTERILEAIKVIIQDALPYADVTRNLDKPNRVPAGGWINIHDGEPGEPEILLGPLRYQYERRSPIDIIPPPGTSAQALLTALDEAVASNRYLVSEGESLVDWMDTEAAERDDTDVLGVEPHDGVQINLVTSYWTTSPNT